jgi:hypothetical protein
MKEHEVPPLDEWTLAVLRDEKSPPRAPRDAAARVMARLGVTLSMPVDPSSLGPRAASGVKRAGRSWPSAILTPGVRLAAAFVAGGIAGATGHAWLADSSRPAANGPARDVPRAEPTLAVSSPEATSPAAPLESTALVAGPAPSSSPGDLNVERALLDQAQRAMARGDAPASLVVLTAHGRRFPHGRLEEEREALAVKTLAALGRDGEAKARGARFRSRFPNSLLQSTVDDTLRSIP